jgi:hypothetical protein
MWALLDSLPIEVHGFRSAAEVATVDWLAWYGGALRAALWRQTCRLAPRQRACSALAASPQCAALEHCAAQALFPLHGSAAAHRRPALYPRFPDPGAARLELRFLGAPPPEQRWGWQAVADLIHERADAAGIHLRPLDRLYSSLGAWAERQRSRRWRLCSTTPWIMERVSGREAAALPVTQAEAELRVLERLLEAMALQVKHGVAGAFHALVRAGVLEAAPNALLAWRNDISDEARIDFQRLALRQLRVHPAVEPSDDARKPCWELRVELEAEVELADAAPAEHLHRYFALLELTGLGGHESSKGYGGLQVIPLPTKP